MQKKKAEPHEIESLNRVVLDISSITPEQLKEVAGGLKPPCPCLNRLYAEQPVPTDETR